MNYRQAMSQKLLQELLVMSEIFPRETDVTKYVVQYKDNKKFLGVMEYDRYNDFFLSIPENGGAKPHCSMQRALLCLVRTDLYKEMREDKLL